MTAVYFFAIILGVLLLVVIVAPLLDDEGATGRASDPDARLSTALEALRELEFDHETGKVGDADYRALRADLAAEAIAARDAGADDRPDGDEGDAGSCQVCGARNEPGAAYCSRCGTAT